MSKYSRIRSGIHKARLAWFQMPSRGTYNEYVDFFVLPAPMNPTERKAYKRERMQIMRRNFTETVEKFKDAHT